MQINTNALCTNVEGKENKHTLVAVGITELVLTHAIVVVGNSLVGKISRLKVTKLAKACNLPPVTFVFASIWDTQSPTGKQQTCD